MTTMAVTYATVDGVLFGESRGGVITRYVPDTLGSVVQTLNSSGDQTSYTEFWPFGEIENQTGTNPSPWGFSGLWGYYTDLINWLYIRARNYRSDLSRWFQRDLIWPKEPAYCYVSNDPLRLIDPSGAGPCPPCDPAQQVWAQMKCEQDRKVYEGCFNIAITVLCLFTVCKPVPICGPSVQSAPCYPPKGWFEPLSQYCTRCKNAWYALCVLDQEVSGISFNCAQMSNFLYDFCMASGEF